MITLNQHRENITKLILKTFSDEAPVQLGFAGFFPSQTTIEKQVGIEVERNLQKVAVDVQRCTDPVRNIFSKSTEKLFEPPFYNESFDFTSCDRYNVTFGQRTNPSAPDAVSMINQTNKYIQKLRNKILRAIEIQRSEVLQTGIVTLKNGDNIDYKRKAASLVALTGTDVWSDSANCTPMTDIGNMAEFIREEGLSVGNEMNVIMGKTAFANFKASAQVKEEADFRRISRVDLGMPQFDKATGMVFQGQFADADYVLNVWTYNSFYTNDAGQQTKYLAADTVIVLPEDFEGITAYAGIPAIQRDKDNAEFPEFITPIESEMYLNNYIDPVKKAHWFEIASAPLAIPVSIDRIGTIKTEE